jgi:hypothetical protein
MEGQQMNIIGAGMAGLLAGGMIRDQPVTIHESASTLPNNHSAVLRFRTSIVGDALDIPFKKVRMMKTSHPWRNPVADALAYSMKTNGTATLRSVTTAKGDISERYIAPENLIMELSNRLNGPVFFDSKITSDDLLGMPRPIISTIPMPVLMKLLHYHDIPKFNYVNGFNINCTLYGADAYVSVYVPDPEDSFNRVSLTGDKLTIEFSSPHATSEEMKELAADLQSSGGFANSSIGKALWYLGISKCKWHNQKISAQPYSKILPIDEGERRRFIVWATDHHGIYSLGRFATWRPGLLMDDVVNDVRVIRKIIKNGSYEHRMK